MKTRTLLATSLVVAGISLTACAKKTDTAAGDSSSNATTPAGATGDSAATGTTSSTPSAAPAGTDSAAAAESNKMPGKAGNAGGFQHNEAMARR